MEDFDITKEEAQRLGEALKQKEFQELLKEYFDDINDPENKRKYQEEVTQFEKERGFDVTFINPEPGYVIKTSVNGDKKAFINICKCDKLGKPISAVGDRSGAEGKNWSIPYSLLKPREDLDKSGKRCVVYDVVFHSETHHLASNNISFRHMVNATALDAIENNLNVKLDRQNLIFPKLGYKGAPVPSIIRKKSDTSPVNAHDDFDWSTFGPPINSWFSQNANKNCEDRSPISINSSNTESGNFYAVPKYLIKHRSPVDIQNYTNDRFAPSTVSLPKELVVEINLPLLNSTETVVLDVMEKSVSLLCEKPAKYKLDLILPYTVNEDAGNAKFDKSTRKLTLVLPLKYRHYSSRECDDSGVESDLGTRTPELSSGDDDSIEYCRKPSKLEESQSETTVHNDDVKLRHKNACFLNPNKHYSLPPFNCDVNENVIMFTLQVNNVDPASVAPIFVFDSTGSSYAIHVQFTSMGSGYFPLHYAVFIKFPFGVKISVDSLLVETLDNYVTLRFQFHTDSNTFTEYYFGVNEDNLEKRLLHSTEVPDDAQESVSYYSKCIAPTSARETNEENHSEAPRALPSLKQRMLTRTVSESSGDDFSSSLRKGILKRTSRSMSESNVDDFICTSSFEMISEEDDGNKNKKSVRFSDVISQKVYRTNSSILGQRKKNQRKIRNKKKALENRRASESETSDWDEKEDKDKSDENLNTKENDFNEERVEQDSLDHDTAGSKERVLLTTDVQSIADDQDKCKVNAITNMMFGLDM